MFTGLVAFQLLMTFLLPVSHAAWQQYRCQGRVQYRPCQEGYSLSYARRQAQHSLVLKHKSPAANPKGRLYAKILRQSFTKLPGQEGLWQGVVQGNGDIHLQIHFLKNGIVQNTRYMGHVLLTNKSSTFKFRTVTPAGDDWTWRITAAAL